MDFGTIKDRVAFYAGQALTGDFESMVGLGVNTAYRDVMELDIIPHTERIFTLSTTSGTSRYGLPIYIKRVLNIEDPTTPKFVWESNTRLFDRVYAGTTESGTPNVSFPLRVFGTQKLPSTTATLTLVSSSSNDTGSNYKVRVTGFDGSSNLVTELVTMTGTSAVATTKSYSSTLGVERVTKQPASGVSFVGDVTVKDNAGNQIALIPTWWDSPEYAWIQFHPIPSASITYNIRCEMRKPPLVNDSDWPDFDQDFHDLLVWGTTKDLLPALGQTSTGDRHRVTYENRLQTFRRTKDERPGVLLVFSDVQSGYQGAQRPPTPWIPGIDSGLAS